MKAYNGNRVLRNLIKIGHWNAGNGAWDKKRIELEALLLQKTPDLLFVSEANLWDTLLDSMRNINGYDLVIPQAMMNKHKYARIVLLIRSGVEYQLKEELMHEDISMIWITLQYSPRKKMTIGGVYREHQHLFCPKPNPSLTDTAQLERWMIILRSWKLAAADPLCTVIGDTNLNFLKWTSPEPRQLKMVEKTQEWIETLGFLQVIRGYTRSWRGQEDSLLDHCWMLKPDLLVATTNEIRAKSDHNYISAILKMKEKPRKNPEIKKRIWKNFCPIRFRNKISNIDWSSFYNCQNIDIINDFFEEKVGAALESEAPMKCLQNRKKIFKLVR